MPGRAFIPGPLAQAQPRVYKSLRGRQLHGLLTAGAGVVAGLLLFGGRDLSGYALSFMLALPGFAYGYFQPEGKPVEYWLRVLIRYHFTPQRMGKGRLARPWWQLLCSPGMAVQVWRRARRLQQFEEVCERGRR